jgi:hypothetical protein
MSFERKEIEEVEVVEDPQPIVLPEPHPEKVEEPAEPVPA